MVFGHERTVSELIKYFEYEKYREQISKLISPSKFLYLQVGLVILILGLIIIYQFINAIVANLLFYTKDLKDSFFRTTAILTNRYNAVILIIPSITIIYFAIILPISYDEAWTYLNFSSRNFFVSLSYYPAPNNHILHSLITNLTHLIFPDFPIFSLRINVVATTILTFLVALYTTKKHFNNHISIAIVGIMSVLFMNIYYGYMSRGYSLVLLFFIISFYFALKIVENPNVSRNWVWFTVFSILGFFSIPSYLYPYLSLNFLILFFNFNKSFILKQLRFSFFTVLLTIVLYLPTILVSGLNALTGNQFVAPKSRAVVFSRLPEFFQYTINDITGFNPAFVLILVGISLVFLIKNREWFYLQLFSIFLILPPILLLVHSVIPFGRTFNYYGFIFVFIFCISFKNYINKIKIQRLLVILISLQILFVYNFNNKIYDYEKYSLLAKEANSKIVEKNKSYLIYSSIFDGYLHFYLDKEKITNYSSDYISKRTNLSADSVSRYDYIIIDHNYDQTKVKQPIYSNIFYNIYKMN
jgi:drug/metabolite transporter superfamily protein YnfA